MLKYTMLIKDEAKAFELCQAMERKGYIAAVIFFLNGYKVLYKQPGLRECF